MAQAIRTEAVILRSIRYGEADRILHLFSPGHGRIGAIAKGARKTTSRFGGRLEPLVRVELLLQKGKGDLFTVTGAQTIASHSSIRDSLQSLRTAAAACDAVARVCDAPDPNPSAYYLLCNELALLSSRTEVAGRANSLAFRLKLLIAVGLAPQLSACASCGSQSEVAGFSGPAGGVLCPTCASSGFAIDALTYEFMVAALGKPLSDARTAEASTLNQVERVTRELVAHHMGIKLRPIA